MQASFINPAPQEAMLRASSMLLIKAWFARRRKCPLGAGKGCFPCQNHNAEQWLACSPNIQTRKDRLQLNMTC